jgi:hypothetical protein
MKSKVTGKASFVCVLLMAGAALSIASAAAAADKAMPNWEGIWQKQGSTNYDWSIPADQREHPPLTPKYQAIYDKRLADRTAGSPTGDPTAACTPPGMPRVVRQPYPREFVVTPHVVYILNEQDHAGTRRIFTDGRQHPAAADLDPTYLGHSIGHWEGETLVVDTVGIRGDTVYDSTGLPHSDKIHVMERIRRRDQQFMEDQVTVEDPESLAHPWTITFNYKNMAPDWQISQYICSENNRNTPDANGHTTNGKK